MEEELRLITLGLKYNKRKQQIPLRMCEMLIMLVTARLVSWLFGGALEAFEMWCYRRITSTS